MAVKNTIGRTTGVYGEAYIQFELARRGWVVDAIRATASGIDLLAWRPAQPGMGISVKTRLRDDKNQRVSVTFFKSEKHMQDSAKSARCVASRRTFAQSSSQATAHGPTSCR